MTNTNSNLGLTGVSDIRFRNQAIRGLQGAAPRLIYATKTGDGLIKIGSSSDVVERLRHIKGGTAEILALKPGTFADELEIHRSLAGHAADGREYYFPSPAVLRVVNEMRVPLGLDPIAVTRRWAS